jgi:DnaA regulatory inactivator Hda
MTQLLLPLKTPPRFTLESLVSHEGISQAVATIVSVYGEEDRTLPALFLYGPPGTGKTHLLHAAASLAARTRSHSEATLRFIPAHGNASPFAGLEELVSGPDDMQHEVSCVAVDDIHLLPVDLWTQFWSLWNKTSRWGCPLMLASRPAPSEIFQDDPHLATRVTSGLVFRLDPPEDHMRMLILDKMARDRHVRISRDVCSYLVTRKSRNVKELEKLLDLLDRMSLELKRRITLPLIKLLEQQGVM